MLTGAGLMAAVATYFPSTPQRVELRATGSVAPMRHDYDVDPTTSTDPPRPAVTEVTRSARRGQQNTVPLPGGSLLERIGQCESGGNYRDINPSSGASGKYQALDSTWGGYGGYRKASDAPPDMQERWARELYAKSGTAPWAASRACWGG